jgi:DNA-binding response OmpR family regulator
MNASVRVLHVDDDRDFASLTAAYLEEEYEEFAVETEPDATRALTRIREESFR